MSNKECVYVVEYKDGGRAANWSTGTRIYTRLHNAARLAAQRSAGKTEVIEYELVPTGRKFDSKGNLISSEE